jgi:type I restriction enzyme R subunit
MPMPTWPPPTSATSCASPATTTKARPSSTTSSTPNPLPGHRHHLATDVHRRRCPDLQPDRARPRINSMTEFKQIIGRGTRINEDYNKLWFTILDFKTGHRTVRRPGLRRRAGGDLRTRPDDPPVPPDEPPRDEHPPDGGFPKTRPAPVASSTSSTTCRSTWSTSGPVLRPGWPAHHRIPQGLHPHPHQQAFHLPGCLPANLERNREEAGHPGRTGRRRACCSTNCRGNPAKELDPFDLICHIAYRPQALTRRERAEQVKKRDYFARYGATARKVLEALLDKYADEGIANLENPEVLRIAPLNQFGSPVEIVQAFGGKTQYQQAIRELERNLYTPP